MRKLFCGLLFFTALISSAQTADEIIEKHLVALGGKEKLKNIASVRMSIKGQGMGMEFPVEMLTKKDGSMKTTTTIQKMKMVQAYDGNSKSGWSINPMMGDKKPQKMNEEQVKDMQEQGGRMVSEFLDYKESGAVAEYLGKDDMDGEDLTDDSEVEDIQADMDVPVESEIERAGQDDPAEVPEHGRDVQGFGHRGIVGWHGYDQACRRRRLEHRHRGSADAEPRPVARGGGGVHRRAPRLPRHRRGRLHLRAPHPCLRAPCVRRGGRQQRGGRSTRRCGGSR